MEAELAEKPEFILEMNKTLIAKSRFFSGLKNRCPIDPDRYKAMQFHLSMELIEFDLSPLFFASPFAINIFVHNVMYSELSRMGEHFSYKHTLTAGQMEIRKNSIFF